MSSPPRCVSPLVASTSKMPSWSLQDGDVERAAAEVVHRDHACALPVEAVGQRRRGRLVDQAQHLETGDAAGVARGRPLGVVEVRRHRDDGADRPGRCRLEL